MNEEKIRHIQGKKIEILEMILTNENQRLKLLWKICLNNTILSITFYNVSRLSIESLSSPLEIYGFGFVNHCQKGWDNDSRYEILDYEDERINFYCEFFEIQEG